MRGECCIAVTMVTLMIMAAPAPGADAPQKTMAATGDTLTIGGMRVTEVMEMMHRAMHESVEDRNGGPTAASAGGDTVTTGGKWIDFPVSADTLRLSGGTILYTSGKVRDDTRKHYVVSVKILAGSLCKVRGQLYRYAADRWRPAEESAPACPPK